MCQALCKLVCKIVAGWQKWQNSGRSCHSADVEPSPLPVVRAAKSTMSQIPSHVILSWFQEGWCRNYNIWGSFVYGTMHVFKVLIVISTRTREDSGAGQYVNLGNIWWCSLFRWWWKSHEIKSGIIYNWLEYLKIVEVAFHTEKWRWFLRNLKSFCDAPHSPPSQFVVTDWRLMMLALKIIKKTYVELWHWDMIAQSISGERLSKRSFISLLPPSNELITGGTT